MKNQEISHWTFNVELRFELAEGTKTERFQCHIQYSHNLGTLNEVDARRLVIHDSIANGAWVSSIELVGVFKS